MVLLSWRSGLVGLFGLAGGSEARFHLLIALLLGRDLGARREPRTLGPGPAQAFQPAGRRVELAGGDGGVHLAFHGARFATARRC